MSECTCTEAQLAMGSAMATCPLHGGLTAQQRALVASTEAQFQEMLEQHVLRPQPSGKAALKAYRETIERVLPGARIEDAYFDGEAIHATVSWYDVTATVRPKEEPT